MMEVHVQCNSRIQKGGWCGFQCWDASKCVNCESGWVLLAACSRLWSFGLPTASRLCRAGVALQVCRLCILRTMDPTLHYKVYQGSQLLKRADVGGAEQTIASMGREHQDGCKAERNHWTVGEFGHFSQGTDHDGRRERRGREAKQWQDAARILWILTDRPLGENF